MGEVVRRLSEQYDWSGSIPNFTGKLKRGSLRYREALELADVLGYDLIWRKRGKNPEERRVHQVQADDTIRLKEE